MKQEISSGATALKRQTDIRLWATSTQLGEIIGSFLLRFKQLLNQ
jgi:hypothetical protein